MEVYLVGGAVRDRLLHYPIKEQDWVVVGATPETLKEQGYRQVGRDFPVFLHPTSGEEYALARTERKSAPGYYGFQCRFDPNVTLEEDLLRRDLTINAMAMDRAGNIIDPYHGQADIEARLLRHVSPAFTEDPLRILRVARFAARYHHLGFRVAEETRQLMYAMVKQSELSYLVAERVWQEWQRSLLERNPQIFIEMLRACGALKEVLPELDALFGVPNPRQYHLEVDSGVHTLLALTASAKLSIDPIIRFTALVHDLGKAATPVREWPNHYGHDEKGIAIINFLCDRLRIPTDYRRLATKVSQLHLLIPRLLELRATTIVKTFEKADAFRQPQHFAKLLVVCEADAQAKGRKDEHPQAEKWRYLLAECAKISPRLFVEQGLRGEAIKNALYHARVTCVAQLLETWKEHEK